jgi:hypothetical protein
MIPRRVLIALSLAAALITGCATKNVFVERESIVISAAYDAVDKLLAGQTNTPLVAPNGRRVLVATAVELSDLNRSSPFGRLLAEQMSSRLAQLGVSVSELKLRGNLYVSPREGELLLSREVKELTGSQSADSVLVTTYVDAGDAVYVTAKLVRASDSTISNAYNFAINKTSVVAGLLSDKSIR